MIPRLCFGACALALVLAASACDRPSTASTPADSGVAATPEVASASDQPPVPADPARTAAEATVAAAGPPTAGAAPLVITQAQVTAEHSGAMEKCLASGDAAKGVTPAMAACINAELQAQDARLNAAYRQAMAGLDSAGRMRLQTEERAWIRQRDEGCAASATGGTIDRLEIPSCVLDETIRRRLVLEALAS